MKYLQQVAKVVGMSSDHARYCLGEEFGLQMPKTTREIKYPNQCGWTTPDLTRCLPKRSPEYAKAYSKQMFLLERRAVAFSDDISEFMGDVHHSEETGRDLKQAVE